MTYRELAQKIMDMTPHQQNCDVTVVQTDDEVFMADLDFTVVSDVLDPDYPIIICSESICNQPQPAR